jgi:LppP/LprE lipoprotein
MVAMRALTLLAGACCALALAACGSQTKTVTVASTPAVTSSTATTTTPTRTGTTSRTTTTTAATPTTSTRTSSEPAFTEQQSQPNSQTAAAAAAIVRAHGFTPNRLSDYHPDQTLRVLLGTRSGSGDGYDQRAFFFLEGRYLGTDAKEPSAALRIVAQSDTEVALAYQLYRHGDPLCCPGGGQAVVHFQLDNGKLATREQIPPASSSSGLSRY